MRTKAAVSTPVGWPGIRPATVKLGLGGSLLAICITTPLAGQLDWHDRSTEPRARYDLVAAYDAARQRVVLFGGYGADGALDDTWEWDGTLWIRRTPATSPPARFRCGGMAYDATRQRVVLFGGFDTNSLHLADTWEWDGTDWTQRTPATSPSARTSFAMAYDGARQRVVLFGGWNRANRVGLGDTWEWDGINWTRLSPATSPPARADHAMAYDSARRRIVLFGGTSGSNVLNDTWEWDGTNWTLQTPAVSPSARSLHAMAYDEARQRVIVFGGSAGASETWEWDGSNWTRRMPAMSPPGRMAHAMAYDQARQRILLFGHGSGVADTWEWDGSNWTEHTRASPRGSGHAMAFDRVSQQAVLFGGRILSTYLSETWGWDGANWAQRTPATSPPARDLSAMASDSARNRVVLFGGWDGTNWLGDTWEWDGTNWNQRSPATSPPGREGHVMAYDPVRRRVVLFGGLFNAVPNNETWEWDGSNWNQATPATSPSPRVAAAMDFDFTRSRVVLFGGLAGSSFLANNETWEWDGSNWTQRTPITNPGRYRYPTMASDPARQRIVLLEGQARLFAHNETWEWDGINWNRSTSITRPQSGGPSAMTYDPARRRVFLFFGGSGYGYPSGGGGTWEYAAAGSYQAFGVACPGTAGMPGLRSDLVAHVGQPFRIQLWGLPPSQPGVVSLGWSRSAWAGIPLPQDLAAVGMPACTLYCSGEFVIGMPGTATGVMTWGFPVPAVRPLVGTSFFNQAFFVDPAANAAGLIATNAGHAVIGG